MWFNPIITWLLRSPLHFFLSENTMLMTYKGRKSGKTFTTPMNYLTSGDTLYTISSRDRVWWRNLRGGAQVSLRLRGKDIPARAESIEAEPDVARDLSLYLRTAPQMASYLDVSLEPDGSPEAEDVASLAQEKVIVATKLAKVS